MEKDGADAGYQATMPGALVDEPQAPERVPSRETTIDNGAPTSTNTVFPEQDGNMDEKMAEQSELGFPTSAEVLPGHSAVGRNTSNADKAENQQHLKSKDPEVDFEDESLIYEPPAKDEMLPDLQKLLGDLDGGDGHLDGQVEPPSLFTRPENVPNYQNITELRLQMEEEEIDDYLSKFDDGVRDDVLMIGSIRLEDIQKEEKKLRDEHILYESQEAKLSRDKQQLLLVKEEEAKKRTALDLKEKRRLIQRKELIQQQRERLMMERLHKYFRRAENQLVSVLERRKGEVKRLYGNLVEAEGQYGGSKGRRWKVDWDKTPQPIQVKLKCLRGVKDKLPAGRYVLMVSLGNRLGGHVMRWSRLKGQQWGGATLPVRHEGHFYNTEIKLDQSVFTVLPPMAEIRPGMVLTFELFILRGAVVPIDRVVGWGAFPIADGQFQVIEGKYKCPFLRGEMDPQVDKHEKIESLMASELDHWLCNLYLEIVKLPRYLAGQKEYEVELQFSSGMLAFPERVRLGGEEYRDGEAPVPGSILDLHNADTSHLASQSSIQAGNLLNEDTFMTGGSSSGGSGIGKRTAADKIVNSDESFNAKTEITGELRKRHLVSSAHTMDKASKAKMAEYDDEDSDTESDVILNKKDAHFHPVKGQPGLFYRKHEHSHVERYHKRLYTLLPRTPLLPKESQRKKKLTYLEELEQHGFSVRQPLSDKGRVEQRGYEKLQYVRRQFFAELGLSQWRSREFWSMVVIFLLTFFLRLYLHYFTQWIYLQILQIPVNKFDFLPYTVNLNYQNTLLVTREEVAMVMLGPFGNLFLFILLVACSWLLQKLLGNVPDIGSKFILAVGIQAFMNPFFILVIDCILKRYRNLGGDNPIADFAKLYFHYLRTEGSGLAGILITIFVYFFLCFAAAAIVYMYFLRLHNNGRLLDIYLRLHGDDDVFLVPYDLELSNQELGYICRKAEQWRGEEGERRKVAIYDYIWEEDRIEETVWDENGVGISEEKEEGKKEITTHVAIHTLHLDGLRELYRHFLRLPDGAIVEVFGDMSVAGMDKDVTKALSSGAKNLENLSGSEPDDTRSGPDGQVAGEDNAAFQMVDE